MDDEYMLILFDSAVIRSDMQLHKHSLQIQFGVAEHLKSMEF